MKFFQKIFCVVLFLFVVISFSDARGSRYTLYIYSDRGLEDSMLTRRERNERAQIGRYLEKDLLNRLRRQKYTTRIIRNRKFFPAKENDFLLYLTITNYRRGGKPRFLLQTSFDLYSWKNLNTPLISKSFDADTNASWQKCVLRVSNLTARHLNLRRMLKILKKSIKTQESSNYKKNNSLPASKSSKPTSLEVRLETLNHLLDKKLISESEYYIKKEQILSEL